MQHLEGSGTPVLYIERTVLKGSMEVNGQIHVPADITSSAQIHRTAIFREFTPCSWVESYQRFGVTCCLIFTSTTMEPRTYLDYTASHPGRS